MTKSGRSRSKQEIAVGQALRQLREAIRSRPGVSVPRIVILGDIIIDRSFYIQRAYGYEPVTYDGPRYMKKRLQTSLGGAVPLAEILAEHCPVLLVYVDAEQGELSGEVRQKLKELAQRLDNLRLRPVRAPTRRIFEITRAISENPSGDNIELRFEQFETDPLSRAQAQEIRRTLRQEEPNASVYVVVDFDRGTITPEIISFLVQQAARRDKAVIVLPYSDWAKYEGLSLHSLICREEQLRLTMESEFKHRPSFADLASEYKFYLAFPRSQNVLIHDYHGRYWAAYVRDTPESRDVQRIRYPRALPTHRRVQTRSVGAAYYILSTYAGLSVEESAIVAGLASDVASNLALHSLPKIEDLQRAGQLRKKIRVETQRFPTERAVSHDIMRAGNKIRLADAETDLPGIFSLDKGYRRRLREVDRVLPRPNKPRKIVSSVLLEGGSGSGKGYLADKIAAALGTRGRHPPALEIHCQDYGSRGKVPKRTEDILDQIAQGEADIVFLDEADKFQPVRKDCQSLFLSFLNSGMIDGQFVDVFVIAAVSTDWRAGATKGKQLPDFFDRFVAKIHVPGLDERPADIPYLLADYYQGKNLKGITLGALESIVRYEHKSFRSFIEDLNTIKAEARRSPVIVSTHLPSGYDRAGSGDTIIFEFDYS